MTTSFLVIDDAATRSERIQRGIRHLVKEGHHPVPTLSAVSSTLSLSEMSVAELAEFDHVLVDFNLGGELKGTESPILPMECAGEVRPIEMRTGIGVMLWLRTVMASPEYTRARQSRGDRPATQIFGFTNPDDGVRARLFLAAALTWFGTPPFQPIIPVDILAEYLTDMSLLEGEQLEEEVEATREPFAALMNAVTDAVAAAERSGEPDPGRTWRNTTETIQWMAVLLEGERAGGTPDDLERALVAHHASIGSEADLGQPWRHSVWNSRRDHLELVMQTFAEAVDPASRRSRRAFNLVLHDASSFWSSPDVLAAMLDHRHRTRT